MGDRGEAAQDTDLRHIEDLTDVIDVLAGLRSAPNELPANAKLAQDQLEQALLKIATRYNAGIKTP